MFVEKGACDKDVLINILLTVSCYTPAYAPTAEPIDVYSRNSMPQVLGYVRSAAVLLLLV